MTDDYFVNYADFRREDARVTTYSWQAMTEPARVPTFHLPVTKRQVLYSTSRLLALDDFIKRGDRWRAFVTLVATPVPGLMAAVVPAFVPLEPLHCGPTWAIHLHLFLAGLFVTWGVLMSAVCVIQVPSSVYSSREVVVVSLCCMTLHIGATSMLWRWWRFPIPFHWVLGSPQWVVTLILAHVIVLRSKCKDRNLLQGIKAYYIGLAIQMGQVVIYPSISVLFDHVGSNYQVAIMILFPLFKVAVKRALVFVSRGLQDEYNVVVVSAVEVCASLYQSTIMQSTPSKAALFIIMGIDIIQGFGSLKFFLDKPTTVPRKRLIHDAIAILRRRQGVVATVNPTSLVRVVSIVPAPSTTSSSRRKSSVQTTIGEDLVVQQALEMTHIAETIVLIEYFEVVVPIVNCVFLVITANLQSTYFSTKLNVFYQDPERLTTAVESILLYSGLQGVSCVVMHLIMKHRYGISAGYLLTFAVARDRNGIVGKMMAWVPLILYFTTVHYGTDFAFHFNFNTWVQW